MSLPLRISDELVLRAREAAEAEDRSISGQVEHWLKLGMALEEILGHRAAIELKRTRAAIPLSAAFATAESVAGRERALAHLRSSGTSRYGPAPAAPGKVVRHAPDGSETIGRFVNRQFVPDRDE